MSVVIRYNDFSLFCFCFGVYNEHVFPITKSPQTTLLLFRKWSRDLTTFVSLFRDQVVRWQKSPYFFAGPPFLGGSSPTYGTNVQKDCCFKMLLCGTIQPQGWVALWLLSWFLFTPCPRVAVWRSPICSVSLLNYSGSIFVPAVLQHSPCAWNGASLIFFLFPGGICSPSSSRLSALL